MNSPEAFAAHRMIIWVLWLSLCSVSPVANNRAPTVIVTIMRNKRGIRSDSVCFCHNFNAHFTLQNKRSCKMGQWLIQQQLTTKWRPQQGTTPSASLCWWRSCTDIGWSKLVTAYARYRLSPAKCVVSNCTDTDSWNSKTDGRATDLLFIKMYNGRSRVTKSSSVLPLLSINWGQQTVTSRPKTAFLCWTGHFYAERGISVLNEAFLCRTGHFYAERGIFHCWRQYT
jgi:hypothetical protein